MKPQTITRTRATLPLRAAAALSGGALIVGLFFAASAPADVVLSTDFQGRTLDGGARTASGFSWSSDLGQETNASTSLTFTGSASGFIGGYGLTSGSLNPPGQPIPVNGNVETIGPWSTSFTFTPDTRLALSTIRMISYAISGGGVHQIAVAKSVQWEVNVAGGTVNATAANSGNDPTGNAPLILDLDFSGVLLEAGTTYTFTATVSSPAPTQGNNIALNSIEVNGGPGPGDTLAWVGDTGGGIWDIDSTVHWKDAGENPATYRNFDVVTFDDTAASGSVTLAEAGLEPFSVTFSNATLPYTLSGEAWGGSGTLAKSGAGEVTLLIDNNLASTTISGGTLRIGDGGTLGSPGNGPIVNDAALVVARDGTVAIPGGISGSGTLEVAGPGTVVLGGDHSHTGATTVSGGTLRAGGTLASPVTVASGGTLAAGPMADTGTTTLGTLTLDADSRSALRVGFGTGDRIDVTEVDGLTINGTHFVDLGAATFWLPFDEFVLFTYDTSYVGGIDNLQVGTAPHGTYSFFDDSLFGEIVVRVDSLDTLVWKGNVDSNWDIDQTANWQLLSDSSAAPYFEHDRVRFDATAGNTTVNLTEEVSPGEIVFDFDAPTTYLVEGGGSIGGPALLEKSGTGTLTLATANSFTGPVDLLGGTLLMEDPEALGAPSGGVEAAPGTVLDINGYAVGAEALALDGAALLNSFPNSATYGGGITFVGGASQVGGDGDIELQASFGGPGDFTKTGLGTVSTVMFATDSNSFTGTITVEEGTLSLASRVHGIAGFNVAPEATLELGRNNMLVPNHGVALDTSRVITVNGGTLLMNGSMDARFGNVTLHDGATFTSDRGLAAWDALFAEVSDGGTTVPGTLAVTGSGAATMNGAGGIHLGGTQHFQIADTTGDPDPDLRVEMILDRRGNNPGAPGGIQKLGAGTMLIQSDSSYDGETLVTEGVLVVTGSLTATSSVTVATGATLGGNGDIAGPVTIRSAGTHSLEIADSPGNQLTRTITGALTLEPGNLLTLTADDPPANGTYLLATASGGITGTLDVVNLPAGITEPAEVAVVGNNLVLTVGDGSASDYDTWAAAFGLTGGPDDDDDGDGLTNFGEYAFGLDPTNGASVSPATTPDTTAGTFTYTRRTQSLTGLAYSYESTTALDGWSGFTTMSETTDNGNPVETITVTLPASLLTEPKLFLRVKAVAP